jgi:hypothetical protein
MNILELPRLYYLSSSSANASFLVVFSMVCAKSYFSLGFSFFGGVFFFLMGRFIAYNVCGTYAVSAYQYSVCVPAVRDTQNCYPLSKRAWHTAAVGCLYGYRTLSSYPPFLGNGQDDH